VRTRILTNSLDVTDVMPIHSANIGNREGQIDSAVEPYELVGTMPEGTERGQTEMLAGPASGLRAKVFGSDEKHVFIGSWNLDPRSVWLNVEICILLASPSIAPSLARELDDPQFAWKIKAGKDRDLYRTEKMPDGHQTTLRRGPGDKCRHAGRGHLRLVASGRMDAATSSMVVIALSVRDKTPPRRRMCLDMPRPMP